MIRRYLRLSVLFLVAGGGGCSTAGLKSKAALSGDVSGRYAYGLDAAETALTRVEGNAGVKLGEGGTCGAEFAGRYRWDRYLEPEESRTAEIRALSLICQHRGWLLSVGRQSVVWGKADGFRVLDIVHPFDFREFVLDDVNAARRPLAMGRLELRTPGNGFVQLLLVPEHRRDILPAPEGRFAPVFLPQTLDLNVRATPVDQPRWYVPGDWQYGGKWEVNTRRVGFSLNYLSKLSTSPTYALEPATFAVQARFPRQGFYGGSLDFPWQRFVLRAETVYSPGVFQLSSDAPSGDYVRHRLLSTALGIDDHLGEWFLSGQLLHDRYFGTRVPAGSQRSHDVGTLLATRSFFQDRTKVRLFLANDLTEHGHWLRASLGHDIRSTVEFSLGVDQFAGRAASVFGRIAREDRVFVQLKWSR